MKTIKTNTTDHRPHPAARPSRWRAAWSGLGNTLKYLDYGSFEQSSSSIKQLSDRHSALEVRLSALEQRDI